MRTQPIAPSFHAVCRLDGLSITELTGLLDSVETLVNVACAMTCQPKFQRQDRSTNAAGNVVEGVLDQLNWLNGDIQRRVMAATPTNQHEADRRARVVLRYRADDDDAAKLARIAEAMSAPTN